MVIQSHNFYNVGEFPSYVLYLKVLFLYMIHVF